MSILIPALLAFGLLTSGCAEGQLEAPTTETVIPETVSPWGYAVKVEDPERLAVGPKVVVDPPLPANVVLQMEEDGVAFLWEGDQLLVVWVTEPCRTTPTVGLDLVDASGVEVMVDAGPRNYPPDRPGVFEICPLMQVRVGLVMGLDVDAGSLSVRLATAAP